MKNTTGNINAPDIDHAIEMLNKYARQPSVEPLISVLVALRQDMDNASLLAQLTDTWRNLGVFQGTVLTYVPYFYTFIPDDIFGDKE